MDHFSITRDKEPGEYTSGSMKMEGFSLEFPSLAVMCFYHLSEQINLWNKGDGTM